MVTVLQNQGWYHTTYSFKKRCEQKTKQIRYPSIPIGYLLGENGEGYQKLFTMDIYNETPEQKHIADYNVYLQLKQLHYSNAGIAEHLSYSKEDLGYLISRYTFKNNLEYQLQQQEGNYCFSGKFYITSNAQSLLTTEEILEIYTFTQDLVKQHQGVDYLQVFYCIEQNCKLFFVDNLSKSMLESGQYSKDDHYCTLMLVSDY
jgi:hypothetical protein